MAVSNDSENSFNGHPRLCESHICQQNGNITFNETFDNFSRFLPFSCSSTKESEIFFTSFTFHFCVYFMYSVIFVIALFGNGLVCYVISNSPQMKTVTNFFIANLAIGDIMMTIFCVPFSFVSMLVLRYWPFGGVMCKVVNFSQAVSVLVSAYTLLAISVDRYIVITQPLKPRLGKTAAKLVISGVWIGAMITATPIFVVSRLQRPSLWHEVCELDICSEIWLDHKQSERYTCALLTLQFLLPLTALVCTYTRIAYVVWGVRPPGEAEVNRDSRIQHSKRKMIKMMVTVVTVFTICWLPLNVFLMLWSAHENDDEWTAWQGMPYVWFASHWLAMSHCCYNPVIYCYMNSRYRRGFQQALRTLFCRYKKSVGCPNHRSSVCEAVPMSELNANGRLYRQGTCVCRQRNIGSGKTTTSIKHTISLNPNVTTRNASLTAHSRLFN
ncbi:unnamed protein product [Leptosia nina]|uniref:G-protein coupled receptors family 1 profile domain-containing protein n=1 Tax=Leptosia nina TaxID=320188 RepID=A0AAV1J8Q0_9NEOP